MSRVDPAGVAAERRTSGDYGSAAGAASAGVVSAVVRRAQVWGLEASAW